VAEEPFFDQAADQVYERLFCSLYEVDRPALSFHRIMHWQSMIKAWELEHLPVGGQTVFIASGFFYGIHTPSPTSERVRQAEEEARGLGTDWIMFPLLRAGAGREELKAQGYLEVPWFVESEYRIRDSVDQDLRDQIGRNTAANIRRRARKAEAEYDLDLVFPDAAGAEEAIARFDELHWENLRKYGHPRNTHGPDQIQILKRSHLAPYLLFCLRREKAGARRFVQASFRMVAVDMGILLKLVQGIRREAVPPYHNLYHAETYQLYKWGEANGVRIFNHGRGEPGAKALIGCNHFHVLAHLVKPLSAQADREQLGQIRASSAAFIAAQLAGVRQKLTRGGYLINDS
jgi:hypothetical protein